MFETKDTNNVYKDTRGQSGTEINKERMKTFAKQYTDKMIKIETENDPTEKLKMQVELSLGIVD